MTRIHNFSAGPAALPEPVLRQAAAEMLDWRGSGMSVMEMSHRDRWFISIFDDAEARLRRLLGVPANYKVLFLQGGGIGENAFVPMNLLRGATSADYIATGVWSKRSLAEAGKYATINLAASSEATGFDRVPPRESWRLDPHAGYIHICANETIGGVEYHAFPETGAVPLVADVSSTILSRPLDVARFGALYAGAQKNIGPAGLTIVIVRDDLLGSALPITPSAFDYTQQAAAGSMLNTPPTYAIYIAGLVFAWIEAQGGLETMAERNGTKSEMLYRFLDGSDFYRCPVVPADRSRMNVVFHLADARLDAAFLDGAEARGLAQLKGHRVAGGMRASLYNAVPIEAVEALIEHLRDFERKHG